MKIYNVPSSEMKLLRRQLQHHRQSGRYTGHERGRVADTHLNWHRLLERTLRFNDASAARVTAAQTTRGWGSEPRIR